MTIKHTSWRCKSDAERRPSCVLLEFWSSRQLYRSFNKRELLINGFKSFVWLIGSKFCSVELRRVRTIANALVSNTNNRTRLLLVSCWALLKHLLSVLYGHVDRRSLMNKWVTKETTVDGDRVSYLPLFPEIVLDKLKKFTVWFKRQ